MSIKRGWKFKSAAALIALGLALTGCAAQNAAAGNDGTQNGEESFVVGIQDPWQAVPFHMAERQGLFKAHNVKLEFQLFSSVTAMTAAVASGEIDAAAQSVQTVAASNHASDASKFQFFAPMQINDTVILARSGTDIPVAKAGNWEDTFKAMKGRTVGVTALGAFADGVTKFAARQVGLDPEQDLTRIAVGIGPTAQAAMEKKQIDVVYELSRGMGMQLQKGLSYLVVDFATGSAPEELSRLFGGGLFATKDQLATRSAAYQALADALKETRKAIGDPANRQAVQELIGAEYAPGDDQLRDFLVSRSFIFSDVELTEDSLSRAVKGYAATGLVGTDVKAAELLWKK